MVRADSNATESGSGLVSAAIRGNEAAFDALVGPLLEPGFKLAMMMLQDREEARDVVQEACVMAWARLFQLREEAQLRSWFLSIVANRCRTTQRSRWWSTLKLPMAGVTEGTSPSGSETQLDLDRALRQLPSRQRAAIFLFFYEDLPLVEVARILKLSPQAAKSLVHRAVVKLRVSMVEMAR